MITVVIYINGYPIHKVEALNVSPQGIMNNVPHTYKLSDTGDIIKHVRNKGSIKLAIKMLKVYGGLPRNGNK